MQPGRMERRIALGVAARLKKAYAASGSVQANIENISIRGARVITDRSWDTNDKLQLITLSLGRRPIPARVVYCEPHADGHYAIGLQFDEPIPESIIGAGHKG